MAKKKPPRRPITGSRVQTLIQCAASGALSGVHEQTDAGTLGSRKHFFLYEAGELGRDAALERVPEDLRPFCAKVDTEELFALLDGTSTRRHEVVLIYDTATDTAVLRDDVTDRKYGPLEPAQIAMTLDLLGWSKTAAVIVDVKTGHLEVTPAFHNWQLRTGAVAVSRALGLDEVTVCIAPLDEEGNWRPFEPVTFDAIDLGEFARDLRTLVARVDAAREIVTSGGTPEVYPSEEACRWCPAIRSCPAKQGLVRQIADVIQIASSPAELQPAQLGEVYAKVTELKKLLGKAEDGIKDIARQAPIPLPDGSVLREVLETRESFDVERSIAALTDAFGESIAAAVVEKSISKASIARGLEQGAEKAIETLRAAGAVHVSRRAVMRVTK